MRRYELEKTLSEWDGRGRRVFTVGDLRKMSDHGHEDAFLVQLRRLASDEDPILKRAARGVYVYTRSHRPATNLIEEIARTIRRGANNYVSLESALSEHGWISQIPVGRITVMTTGRGGLFNTPFGDIEFTHTERPWSEFYDETVDIGRPLRLATPARALRDLRRVGRNIHLVQPIIEEEPHAEFS